MTRNICINFSVYVSGVVHEHPRIGSDGESEEGSGTSEDPNVSPGSEDLTTNQGTDHTSLVKLRQKPNQRKLSNQEEINKRLSLPADLKLPDNFISRQAVSPTLEGPLSRYVRSRVNLSRMNQDWFFPIRSKLNNFNGLVTAPGNP